MRNMANLGKGFEDIVILTNEQYRTRGIALIQKIATPWKVVRSDKKIVSAYAAEKSTLDFRGSILGGKAISFDCKETENDSLPLANIDQNQIDFIKDALAIGEISFVLCYISKTGKYYYIPGRIVLEYWNTWQINKGKRGYNSILVQDMIEIKSKNGIILDYLDVIKKG